jgi:hypothetical protein
MSDDFDQYESSNYAHLFNYFDEVLPAKTNAMIEFKMVGKLKELFPDMSMLRARRIIEDMVHVAKQYMVTDKPLGETMPK